MIVFDLHCRDGGETFEAWFRSSSDYDEQLQAGLVECPFCQSANIAKAPMAPRVPRKGAGNARARLVFLAVRKRAQRFPRRKILAEQR